MPKPDWMIGPEDGRDGSEQTPGGHRRGRRSSWLIAAYSVFGLGFGMVNPPITNTAVSGMPGAQAGVAAAIASTSRLVGISLGVAVSGAIVVAGRGNTATSVAQASHPAWWISAACGLAVVALGLISTSAWALRSARVGKLIGPRPKGTLVSELEEIA